MNIFILDLDPEKCAEYHCDKHVVKMPIELAQMLSTAHVINGSQVDHSELYLPTHMNHPCSVWVRESLHNYLWALHLLKWLLYEYRIRFGRPEKTDHATLKLFEYLADIPNFNKKELTPFVLAMPEDVKKSDPVESYREYYRVYKQPILTYKNGKIPPWLYSK